MTLEELLGRVDIEIADIGAAPIAETPRYVTLTERGLGRLNAFDADRRHEEQIRRTFGARTTFHPEIVGDGNPATLYVCWPLTGMTSLLKPSAAHLALFNNFTAFGEVIGTEQVETVRFDDVADLPQIDFLKMDIQGSELGVLKSGTRRLAQCVALQLEVSFVPLYEGQPVFGEVDMWLRAAGFLPHAFEDIKRWSVSPLIRNDNFRHGFNQLLEADVVYFRDITRLDRLGDDQLRKLAVIAHYCYRSPDVAGRLIVELTDRGVLEPDALASYRMIWFAEQNEMINLYGA